MSITNNCQKTENILSKKKFFIFDFDGVIADSVEVKTSAFSKMYSPYGDEIVEKVIRHHRENGGMSRYDKFRYYHTEFLGKTLSTIEIDNLATTFANLVIEDVISSNEIAGATQFLKKYCTENKLCFVNSATPTTEIQEIIKRRKLAVFFTEIYGSPYSKLENIKNMQKCYSLDLSEGIFFGDAFSDFAAAKTANMDFIGIGNTIKEILECQDGEWIVFKNFTEYLNGS